MGLFNKKEVEILSNNQEVAFYKMKGIKIDLITVDGGNIMFEIEKTKEFEKHKETWNKSLKNEIELKVDLQEYLRCRASVVREVGNLKFSKRENR